MYLKPICFWLIRKTFWFRRISNKILPYYFENLDFGSDDFSIFGKNENAFLLNVCAEVVHFGFSSRAKLWWQHCWTSVVGVRKHISFIQYAIVFDVLNNIIGLLWQFWGCFDQVLSQYISFHVNHGGPSTATTTVLRWTKIPLSTTYAFECSWGRYLCCWINISFVSNIFLLSLNDFAMS